MSWWEVAPAGLALAAVWVAPGWAVLRLLGVTGTVAVGAGPAATAALVGLLGLTYDAVGVPWSTATMLVGLVAVPAAIAAVGLVGLRRTFRRTASSARTTYRWGPVTGGRTGMPEALPAPMTGWHRAALAGALGLAAVLVAGPLMAGMGSPDRPEQAWDAVFHLNAVATIHTTGNASSLGALGPLFGGGDPYYPAVWPAMTAAAPGLTSVPGAANVHNIVIAAVVWPLGIAALARVVFRPPLVATVAAVLSASFVAFPTLVMTLIAPWPYGLSVALLPGAAAVLTLALRRRWSAPGTLRAAVATAVTAGGVVLAHGSGAFSLAVLAGPLVIGVLVARGRAWWQAGRPRLTAVIVTGVGLALAGVAVVLARLPQLRVLLGYERAGAATYTPTLRQLLTDAPLVYDYGPLGLGNLAVTVLAVAGAAESLRRGRGAWLAVAWLLGAVLVLLAAGPPENPLRILTGFWYTQAARIAPVVLVPVTLFAAAGLVALGWGRWRAHPPGAGEEPRPAAARGRRLAVPLAGLLLLGAVTDAFRWDLRQEVTASVYEPGQVAWGAMLTEPEMAMIDRTGPTLPPDALVLGDPFNGSAYLPALAGVEVVFPQLGSIRGDDARLLESSFDQLHRDPAVCEAVRSLGVTHFYSDTAGAEEGAKVHPRTEALREVDTSRGFELVDSGGTARVWRLTACE